MGLRRILGTASLAASCRNAPESFAPAVARSGRRASFNRRKENDTRRTFAMVQKPGTRIRGKGRHVGSVRVHVFRPKQASRDGKARRHGTRNDADDERTYSNARRDAAF